MNDLIVTCYLLLVTIGGGGVFRPYCYLLLVTIGGGEFGRQNMCSDLIVTCYLLPLGVVNLGGRTCVPTLLLVVSC